MKDVIKASFARVALQWATDPYSAEQTYRHLFEEQPTPVTYDDVEKVLGAEAATAWKKVVAGTAEFNLIVYGDNGQ